MLMENVDIWPSNDKHNTNLLTGISKMVWKKPTLLESFRKSMGNKLCVCLCGNNSRILEKIKKLA